MFRLSKKLAKLEDRIAGRWGKSWTGFKAGIRENGNT